MKDRNRNISLARICRVLGMSRQAYYQHWWRNESTTIEQELVLKQIINMKKDHRHMGTRKLYELIQPFLLEHQIKMGRDALFDLLSTHGLLVKRYKRRVSTTNSFHMYRKFPNLIKSFVPTHPNQLWVSDITYWKISDKFLYISFITDAFSRKILGYNVADNLLSIETVKALKMALLDAQNTEFLCHHSDRGLQYCCNEYVQILEESEVKISMTETGDPRDNAVAERLNGIIKNEYLSSYTVKDLEEGKQVLDFVIKLYNEERPHMSIGNLTPEIVHRGNTTPTQLWKNYYHKNSTIVNPIQEEQGAVNLEQY
ncbi:IS3 family transposase [Pedobacter jejuensis]|uniref:IS3 family transposase n=1 Tax=Pedobacter jejuensis TaxID=1268550 RepID=A0A3N0BTZ1_9SPHI|nr:IS3 family transposase [Pedobacter jejuensis]RNL52498.1 IS3 family transposase [Pedobacter jejuensis]